MIQEQIFTRRFAVRMPQQLLAPRLTSVDFLEFPKQSAYHFTEVDNVAIGPTTDEYYFRNIAKKIPVRHITKLVSAVGNPRHLSLPIDPIIRNFHAKHRRYRWLRHGDPYPTDENQLVVINHALSSRNYKYVRSPFADYNRWWNINATIFFQLGRVAKESGRHQYAVFNIPRQLPSLPRLNAFVKRQSQDMLKTFSDKNSALLLELWKWLDPETRHMSTLNFADPTQYDKINLVFEESGKWMCFNLGLLDQWIYVEKRPEAMQSPALESYDEDCFVIRETKDWAAIISQSVGLEEFVGRTFDDYNFAFGLESITPKVKITPDQMRKRILRAMMTLMETRTVDSAGDATSEAEEQEELAKSVNNPNPADQDQSTEDGETLAELKLKTLDDDLKQLEVIEKEADIQESVAATLSEEKAAVVVEAGPIQISDFEIIRDHHTIVKDLCDKLANDGLMSGAEYRRMLNINDKAQELLSPVDGIKMKDYIHISPEDLKVRETSFPDRATVLDKEQLKSTLREFDKNYIEKLLKKETVRMALATQNAGFVITDYKVEEHSNILGTQEVHSFKINPVVGKPSTVYFKVPKIDSSGEFMAGGNNYRMRKQRTDLPIRKIGPDRVQLSSYYGKVFVSRSEKRVNNYSTWLVDAIQTKAAQEGSGITNLKPGNVFHNLSRVPTSYSAVSMQIREITAQGFVLHFDDEVCKSIYTPAMVAKYAGRGFMVFGDNGKGTYLLIDNNNTLYTCDGESDPEVKATFEEFFDLDSFKAPIQFAECRVFGQGIPVGIVMGYYYGLERLMTMLKVTPRRVLVGQRVNLQAHEWSLDFADETLVFNKDDRLASLILGGFNEYAKSLKNYSVYKFDSRAVYPSVLEQRKITIRYIREMDLLDDMFVDPITKDLLTEMKEPTTFRGLLIRSSELLMTDYHPNPLNMDYQTIRGYERVAGAIYSEMVMSIREQRRSLGRSTSQISLNPLAVWKRVVGDPAVKIVEDINPVNNCKEMEAVTFSGIGGRAAQTMNAASRVYDESDKGVISEATSDSGDVAINTYTVSNPSFNSVRGTTFRKTDEQLSGPSLLSTSANLAVGADTDDPKRINFISIQNSHTVACDGYTTLPVRTGYEQVMSHRVGDGYCTIAEEDGIVESIVEGVGGIVRYKNGTTQGFTLGRRFGKAGGQTIPHEMATTFKTGDKVKAGEVIAFNSGWFEPDYFNKGQVLFKAGSIATVALVETKQTHEDACTITEKFSRKLGTKLTKVKKVRLEFTDVLSNIVKPGQEVDFDSPLVLIQDEMTANMGAFSADTIATLASMSQQAPAAKTRGVIEKIEVYYHGSKDDMSPSVRAVANYGDKMLQQRAAATGAPVYTGSTDESYRVDGDPLLPGTMCVVFHITDSVSAGIADKVVFANQMKSIISEIADYEIVTESGIEVDAFFGAYSIFKRIVNSPFTMGTTTVLMQLGARHALKMYHGK